VSGVSERQSTVHVRLGDKPAVWPEPWFPLERRAAWAGRGCPRHGESRSGRCRLLALGPLLDGAPASGFGAEVLAEVAEPASCPVTSAFRLRCACGEEEVPGHARIETRSAAPAGMRGRRWLRDCLCPGSGSWPDGSLMAALRPSDQASYTAQVRTAVMTTSATSLG
jgi:hypothetical protein